MTSARSEVRGRMTQCLNSGVGGNCGLGGLKCIGLGPTPFILRALHYMIYDCKYSIVHTHICPPFPVALLGGPVIPGPPGYYSTAEG